jgi:hypothetical protein
MTRPGHTWGYLEPGTSEEIESLEQSVAQGEWTIGRGAESTPAVSPAAEV